MSTVWIVESGAAWRQFDAAEEARARVLDRRGEVWAASVLGRDISRRSLLLPARPYLRGGEDYALVAADRAEDAGVLAELDL